LWFLHVSIDHVADRFGNYLKVDGLEFHSGIEKVRFLACRQVVDLESSRTTTTNSNSTTFKISKYYFPTVYSPTIYYFQCFNMHICHHCLQVVLGQLVGVVAVVFVGSGLDAVAAAAAVVAVAAGFDEARAPPCDKPLHLHLSRRSFDFYFFL
jgi:hypothetical protein